MGEEKGGLCQVWPRSVIFAYRLIKNEFVIHHPVGAGRRELAPSKKICFYG